MSLLDVFVMKFVTEGLDDVSVETKDANKNLDEFANKADKASDKVNKLDNSVKGFIMNGIKRFSPYVLALGALRNAFLSINDIDKSGIVLNKDTVKNAKDLELTMRDIRSGAAQIGADLASTMLPTLNKLAVIANNVVKFFGEHMPFVKIALGVIGLTLLPEIIKGIQMLGWSWKKTGIALALTGIILLLDDIYAWMTGGNSAFEDFYNKIFGSAEQFNQKLGDIIRTLKEMPTWLQVVSGALVALVALNPFQSLLIGGKGIVAILKFIPPLVTTIFAILKGITALFISNPILLAITAIVAATILIWKNWDKIVESVKKAIDATKKFLGIKGNKDAGADGSHAGGLDYVPFDGYRAILHKGERVQTASEANDWRSGLIAAKKAINFTASYPLNSIPTGAVSNAYAANNTTNNKTATFTGDIIINTQATDGQGVVDALRGYIKQAVISLDDGMIA